MKKKTYLLFTIASITLLAFTIEKPAYNIFSDKGLKTDYSSMISSMKDADIIFFGELHDNPISHWLELIIAKELYLQKKSDLIIAAEMFESDNQLLLDEYIYGQIKQKSFEDEAKLWNNYKTDYKPIVEFAKENKLKFIASNIPRRYASVVNSKGFEGLDSLSKKAKKHIAPLPIKYDSLVNCYKEMMQMGGMGSKHVNFNLPKAQAAKDATMAYFILENWSKGKQIFHFNGSYHSDNQEGILWHLKKRKPNLKTITISTVEQTAIDTLDKEYLGRADFIICIPDDMTKTQ